MKKLAIVALLASLHAVPALALDVPSSSRYDHRIRYVTYNPADVVQVDTVLGVATHIMLEEGEQYLTHAFGIPKPMPLPGRAGIFLSSRTAELANTNLIVVTDRRSYKFRLQMRNDRNGAMYELAFRYPDTQARQTREANARAAVEAAFEQRVGAYYNLKYMMSGDKDIAPVNAWDDGRFTYFKFSANADLPSIYFVDAEGNESLVPRTTVGSSNNIIAVHKVNPKWMIRLGNRALAIFNEAYDPNGVPNDTGTASPAVRRVNKGGN
uniref:Type IV secretion system protein TrwF n=1 Tax=Escherichia coli TaxID=562 RepID=TRWF_ECOLX|nr:TrbG/VirB9 family P-type conjugative transfer protein [Escherichia coli]CAA57030.1 TrwF protein [Escherichia coli]FAA00036.1 TPA: TrwF protein [Escherichia coli]